MVVAMATFALGDALLKIISLSLPVSQILIITGFAGGVLNLSIMCITKTRLFIPELKKMVFLMRSATDLLSALFFVWAIATTPLSSVSAVLQTAPLMITIGAVIVYREAVGSSHWTAIFVGLIGVMLIVRPMSEAYQPSAWLAVLATFCVALRDLLTRAIAEHIPSLTISTYSFFAVGVGGLIILPFGPKFIQPSPYIWWLLGGATILGTFANFMLILATRWGDASIIAPFRYTRLVFSLLLAVLVMDEQPLWETWIGATMIVVSGCYIIFNERHKLINRTGDKSKA